MSEKRDGKLVKSHERLYDKFNDVELDQFMKVLNIRPEDQWEDKYGSKYK